jgi:porin
LQTGFKSGFLISEAGDKWTLSNGRDGRLSTGLWYHSGQLAHVADNGYDNGAVGGYATFDQMLWRAEPDKAGDKKGLAMFAIAGYANPRTNADNWDLTGGLEWRGLIPTRDNDVIGAAVSTIRLNDAPGSGLADNNQETIEGFYKVSVAKWLSVEPDLQYIHNPGAITTQHDGLMFTLEVVADF